MCDIPPREGTVLAVAEAMAMIGTTVECLLLERYCSESDAEEMKVRVREGIMQRFRGAVGNRSAIGWAELKLMVETHMRELLKRFEGS